MNLYEQKGDSRPGFSLPKEFCCSSWPPFICWSYPFSETRLCGSYRHLIFSLSGLLLCWHLWFSESCLWRWRFPQSIARPVCDVENVGHGAWGQPLPTVRFTAICKTCLRPYCGVTRVKPSCGKPVQQRRDLHGEVEHRMCLPKRAPLLPKCH